MERPTFYRTTQIDGLSIFYREAGPKDAPTLLLLHGLPSSRMFEPLFARLSDHYHITLSRPITRVSDTATGRTREYSRIPSITTPRS
jgi:pimeloyl-ACP methyl ester carboxylesterase